jgi:predicted transporter
MPLRAQLPPYALAAAVALLAVVGVVQPAWPPAMMGGVVLVLAGINTTAYVRERRYLRTTAWRAMGQPVPWGLWAVVLSCIVVLGAIISYSAGFIFGRRWPSRRNIP